MGPPLFMGPWSKSSEPSVKGQRSWFLYVLQSLFLVQTKLLFKESYRGVLVITSKHVHPPSPAQLKPSAGRPGGGRSATSIVPPTDTHMRSDEVFTSMLLSVSDVVYGLLKHWGIAPVKHKNGAIYFAFIKHLIGVLFFIPKREHFHQSLRPYNFA